MLRAEPKEKNLTVIDLNLNLNPNRNLECNYCHKMGHIKVNCFKLKTRLKQRENMVRKILKLSNLVLQLMRMTKIFLVTDDRTRSKNKSILNSGCSYHMCPNKDLFSTYKPCNDELFGWAIMPFVLLVRVQSELKCMLIL